MVLGEFDDSISESGVTGDVDVGKVLGVGHFLQEERMVEAGDFELSALFTSGVR